MREICRLRGVILNVNCKGIFKKRQSSAVWSFLLLIVQWFFVKSLDAQYKGTGSVSQGKATTITSNLLNCTGGRVAGIGTIKSSDNQSWTVPAETQYSNPNFPWASDLNNACNGHNYKTSSEATAALTGSDIITVDADGEVVTGYIFADNYFEMHVNGVAIGKDKVPFTPFNSSIVRFKVKLPFTVAMLLVDWEENLGLGSELNGGFAFHPGDGGMVAVFKNASGKIIGKTDASWKAQTFYTSPIIDLSCPTESGQVRSTSTCSTSDSKDGSSYYGLHWSLPNNWMEKGFDDSQWPAAAEFTNAVIGVDNKPAYTNFMDIFDDNSADAKFIWSSNVILDNEVVVRGEVGGSTMKTTNIHNLGMLYPNPSDGNINLENGIAQQGIDKLRILTLEGFLISEISHPRFPLNVGKGLDPGLYVISMETASGIQNQKIEIVTR